MADRLDDVARMMAAQDVPRRRALRGIAALFGGGLFGLGAIRPAAAAPPVRCQPGSTNCGGVCRDTSIDPDNCGACGTVCPSGQQCRGGACVACICQPGCGAGEVRCNGVCVSTQTNTAHCGACGNACASGETCSNGTCQGGCAGANLNTDPQNCGVCGRVCSFPNASAVCVNGNCAIGVCAPGFADCNGVLADGCETNLSSNENCGACGNVCSPGQVCSNGSCVASAGCTPGQTRPCYSGPPGTAGVGICRAGSQTCSSSGTWGACIGEQTPKAELCNNLDDDCNGAVDDNPAGTGGSCVNDQGGSGVVVCVNGQLVCR